MGTLTIVQLLGPKLTFDSSTALGDALFMPAETRRARRGREQDVAEISRRMYEEIKSSRDPRDHVEDG